MQKDRKLAEALQLALKVLDLQEKQNPKNIASISLTLATIGTLYQFMNQLNKSLEYRVKALHVRLVVHKTPHHDVAQTHNNIGKTYELMKQYDKALENYQKAAEIWLACPTGANADVAICYSNIGVVLRTIGKVKEAIEFYQLALAIQLQINDLGAAGTTSCIMGAALASMNKHKEAEESYRNSLNYNLQAHGENHPQVAIAYCNTGVELDKLGDAENALEMLKKSFIIGCSVFRAGDNNMMAALFLITETVEKVKNRAKSKKVLQEIYPFCVNSLGKECEETKEIAALIKKY